MHDHYQKALERVVNCIERSLSEPLALDALSEEAGFSKFHLHRVFRALTGYPLAEYVRRRRLSRSLESLRNPSRSVLDVALESGFSHEQSYIRAFKSRWGLTPGSWRLQKTLLEITEPVAFGEIHPVGRESALLAPRLVARPRMHLCGLRYCITDAENEADNTVARIANRFIAEERPLIKDPIFPARYVGYVEHCENRNDNVYHTCAELRARPKYPPPDGMRHIAIKEGMFREFLLVSRVHPIRLLWSDVAALYDAVFRDWLPNNPECARAGWHLEYVDLANAADDYGEFRILIPISQNMPYGKMLRGKPSNRQ